jgi:hypothetical protein
MAEAVVYGKRTRTRGTKEGHADPNPDVDCYWLSVTVLKKAVFDFSKYTLLFKTLFKLALKTIHFILNTACRPKSCCMQYVQHRLRPQNIGGPTLE